VDVGVKGQGRGEGGRGKSKSRLRQGTGHERRRAIEKAIEVEFGDVKRKLILQT
jgi:hypothetical protein